MVYLEKRLARVVVELEGRTLLSRDVTDVYPAVTAIITNYFKACYILSE